LEEKEGKLEGIVGREGGKTRGNGRERRRESWLELSGEKEGR
jgi:hypothetical protein